jgi:DNA polymerase
LGGGEQLDQKYLILDFETRSEVDLKSAGVFNYAANSTTQILCAAWSLGTKSELRKAPVKCWSSAFKNSDSVQELVSYLLDPQVRIVAHNAQFERLIIRDVLSRRNAALKTLPFNRFHCTAAQAAALALPRNLEEACLALKLPVQKDVEGRRLILKYCKPRRVTKNNPAKWHRKASDLRRLMEYCRNDVRAEIELFLTAPELPQKERETWLLDQKINDRGFMCDRELCEAAVELIYHEAVKLHAETRELTGGEVQSVAQVARTLAWLKSQGYVIPDLQAKTVADILQSGKIEGKPKRLLEIRQELSRSSTKKYLAFLNQMSVGDDRARGTLLYHGASTGRWTARGLQPHNMPRPLVKDLEWAVDTVKTRDVSWLRVFYDSPMKVLSSVVRPVIKAPEGFKFFGGDFSAIEVRVLFWLAGHKDGIKAYFEERDLYREMAAKVFRIELDSVTAAQREIGKRIVLGAGYGMGHKKFAMTCKQFGLEVDEDLARHAVSTYREVHAPVPNFWRLTEMAAIEAVKQKGKRFTIGKTKWFFQGRFLWCELPSDRRLAYCDPEIRYEPAPWGEKIAKLYFWQVHPKTHKWVCMGTYGGALVENLTQATARDIMRDAMFRLDPEVYRVVLTVHDEILAESNRGRVEELENVMKMSPYWALDCPVDVKCWSGDRYIKS